MERRSETYLWLAKPMIHVTRKEMQLTKGEPRGVTDVLSQALTRPVMSTRREVSEFERVEG